MDLAKEAIKLLFEIRSLHNSTIAIRKEKIEELKVLLKEFQEKVTKFVEDENRDQIYHFSMMLFPIDQSNER